MLSLRSLLALWLALCLTGATPAASVAGPKHSDGSEVDEDLPTALHLKNRGGSDGAGLCVFASLTHSGRWHDDPVFASLFEFMFTRPGGGYPDKVDKMVKAAAQAKNLPVPEYIQVEGSDLDILRQACQSGRLPGVTYGFSPSGRYGGQRISHMVSLVGAGIGKGPDGKGWWCVLDNNFPGTIEWMSEDEFKKTYTSGGGGWCVILVEPGPPPCPRNAPVAQPHYCPCESRTTGLLGPLAGHPVYGAKGYTWSEFSDGDNVALLLDGEQVGLWVRSTKTYKPFCRGVFGKPTSLPRGVDGPDGPVVRQQSLDCWECKGVDASKLTASSQPRYTLSGEEVSREKALGLITSPKLPDDKTRVRVTVIGPVEANKAALSALAGISEAKDKVATKSYSPGSVGWWAIKDGGFKLPAEGKTALYIQKPSGEVLVRQADFTGSVQSWTEALAGAGVIRRPEPYDPDKDPDGKPKPKPNPGPAPQPGPAPGPAPFPVPNIPFEQIPWGSVGAFGAVGAVTLWSMTRRRKGVI